MNATGDPRVLDDCVAPLDEEDRNAVHQYWDQVIQEEWAPRERHSPGAVLVPGDGSRQRRKARRAMAQIVAAPHLSGSGVAA
ncbi:MAG: hypothetical protein ACRDQ0_09665 [Pseudonocardia sp.]